MDFQNLNRLAFAFCSRKLFYRQIIHSSKFNTNSQQHKQYISQNKSKSHLQPFVSSSRGRFSYNDHQITWLHWLKPSATILAAFLGYQIYKSNNVPLNLVPTVQAKTLTTTVSRRSKNNFIADVVEECANCVVYIEIKDKRIVDYYTKTPVTASNGSGFIIESDGLILTNAHVVINKPHTTVQVRLADGRTFPGEVESVDQASDLATVRIQCKNLPVMKLGQSASLRTGEWVIALGSPLSLSNTVTAGVVSNTQRASQDLGLQGSNINYIQTDAAITFGNSGGPLVNLDGEAIGVNSMKVTSGISFAIPIDYVKQFLVHTLERRSKTGQVYPARRYMGITMLTLTQDLMHELKSRSHTVPSEVQHGVLVWKVILNSPAHAGGLSPGDIITHINGKEVKNSNDIYKALAENTKVLEMKLYRGYEVLKIYVTPEDP